MRLHPRRARAQPRERHGDAHHRARHRARSPRHVRPRGRRGARSRAGDCATARAAGTPPTSTWNGSSRRYAPPAPTRHGWAGASSPSRPHSPSCASDSTWSSSGRARRRCDSWATRSPPSSSPSAPGSPVVPWSGGAIRTPADAVAQARALGFPLLLKARGGRRRARHPRGAATRRSCWPPWSAAAPRRARFRRRHALPRAAGRRRAARRGAGRRRPLRGGVGARCPGLHHPAPPSEGAGGSRRRRCSRRRRTRRCVPPPFD